MPSTFDYKNLAFRSRFDVEDIESSYVVNKFGMNLATAEFAMICLKK